MRDDDTTSDLPDMSETNANRQRPQLVEYDWTPARGSARSIVVIESALAELGKVIPDSATIH